MALNNVPLTGQTLNTTRDDIKNNFSVIDIAFSVDNVSYNSGNQGKHNKVTFVNQALAPAFLAGEVGIFNQNAAPTSRPDIWLTRGVSAPFPATGYANGVIAAGLATAWTYLPSGFLSLYGTATTSGGTVTVVFNATASGGLNGFPGFSSFICNLNALRIDNIGSSTTVMRVKSFTLTTATFGLANGSTDSNFFWSVTGL